MSILGTRVVRTEDPLFLTRGATYTDDLADDRLTGALHATFVRSTVAHPSKVIARSVTNHWLSGAMPALTASSGVASNSWCGASSCSSAGRNCLPASVSGSASSCAASDSSADLT